MDIYSKIEEIESERRRLIKKFGFFEFQWSELKYPPFVKFWCIVPIVIKVRGLERVIYIEITNCSIGFVFDHEPQLSEFPELYSRVANAIAEKFKGKVVTWTRKNSRNAVLRGLGVLCGYDVIKICEFEVQD